MSRFHSYINTAVNLIVNYNGGQPFAIYIKTFFSQNKKYGSKDRKQISALCYNYFRLGFAMKDYSAEQRIIAATFLCEQTPSDFLGNINAGWNEKVNWPLEKKAQLIKDQFILTQIFPFKEQLSEHIDVEDYCRSMLVQPSLFLRIRPQSRLTALKKLERSKLVYQLLSKNCIELPAGTNAQNVFVIDKEVTVQDYNSQQVLNYLSSNEAVLFASDITAPAVSTWDCCAASGGKSILLWDILKSKIDLTVSDIRLNIMLNLHQRFKRANIKEYKYFVEDIGSMPATPPDASYQLIICDAPCTGSGTWSRTPEQVFFFNEKSIKEFSEKQKRIVSNVIPHLKEGGIFVYITCSIFKEENEAIAAFIKNTLHLEMLHKEILKGFDKKADTMFVSVFKKPG